MESLSFLLSIPPIHKTNPILNFIKPSTLTKPSSSFQSHKKWLIKFPHPHHHLLILPTLTTLTASNPSLAAVLDSSSPLPQDKINLEAIVVSIDDFFNKYPFFVTFVAVIWLVVIPLAEYYFSRFKYTSALDAFQKLRDDPNAVLLDIRDDKSVAFLGTPDLTLYNKTAVNVHFREDEVEHTEFVNKVLGMFEDPGNTVLCVLDNFDGSSYKVAELLVKNGFKEAYAIKGGLRGKKGWQEIQEDVFPPSVHVYRKVKTKGSNKKEKTENLGNGSLYQDNGSIKNPIRSSSGRDKEL